MTLSLLYRRDVSLRLRSLALGNVVACGFFLGMTFMATILMWFLVLPHFYRTECWALTCHKAAIVYLFVNVLGNFLLCQFTNSSVGRVTGSKPGSGSSYCGETCKRCDWELPNRSHHCILCETCVLRRDHHCFFMATCIGYHNHKHFIFFCLYMWIGTFYAVIMIVRYTCAIFPVKFNGPQSFIYLTGKLFMDVLSGNPPPAIYQILIFMMCASLGMGLFSAAFLYWQIVITLSGQTTNEATKGVWRYSRSRKANWSDVFGKYWCVLFLLPLPLPQGGKGLYSPRKKTMKGG